MVKNITLLDRGPLYFVDKWFLPYNYRLINQFTPSNTINIPGHQMNPINDDKSYEEEKCTKFDGGGGWAFLNNNSGHM